MSVLHEQRHRHIYFDSQLPYLPGLAIDLQKNLRDYRNGILFIWCVQNWLGLRAMHSVKAENYEKTWCQYLSDLSVSDLGHL